MTVAWALVFGALISPTDPVAVLSVLKNVKVPSNLEVEMQGESLFNDGVGIVLFTVLLRFAAGGGDTSVAAISELLLLEAGGGVLLGLVTGYIAYQGMRLIDDYPIEVLISLALVTGNLCCRAAAACQRAAFNGGRGPADRRSRPALCHEREDADLRLRSCGH